MGWCRGAWSCLASVACWMVRQWELGEFPATIPNSFLSHQCHAPESQPYSELVKYIRESECKHTAAWARHGDSLPYRLSIVHRTLAVLSRRHRGKHRHLRVVVGVHFIAKELYGPPTW